jgi:hypothetical protein
MSIDECEKLAEAHFLRILDGQDKSDFPTFDPKDYRQAAEQLGLKLPESWLRLLPYFVDAIPCSYDDDQHCELKSSFLLVKHHRQRKAREAVKSKWDEMQSARWLEFGSTSCGDSYTFDLDSAEMPRDARVIRWNHEVAKQAESWDTVADFVAKMLGPMPARH